MNRLRLALLTFIVLSVNINAQQISVEDNLWGVQVGILPLSVYNETKLTDKIALRTELGFGFGWSNARYDTNSFQWAVIPVAIIEPRYYYNLNKRNRIGKRTDGNSGNYLSLNFGYNSDFVISNSDVTLYPSIHIAPMYGLKRSIGRGFDFEFSCGLGYGWTYKEYDSFDFEKEIPYTYSYIDKGTILKMRLVFGYKF